MSNSKSLSIIRFLGIGTITLAIAYFFAKGVLSASDGANVQTVFAYGVPTWGGYLFAHYLATGNVIDEGGDSRDFHLPAETKRRFFVVIGSIMMVIAIPTGIYGMHTTSLPITALAVLIFLTGYYTAHYSISSQIL